ncbi:MAG: hypothetical protein K6E33_02965 [Lachnospiraceae bacterium]|nr:hypothetical protein [Lachnospiraceae bacterium]
MLKALMVVSFVIYAVGVLSAGYVRDYGYVVALMIVIPLVVGYSQGIAYMHIAEDMYDEADIGCMLGISFGASIIIQYFIQIRFDIGVLLPVLMCCLYFLMVVNEYRADAALLSASEGDPDSVAGEDAGKGFAAGATIGKDHAIREAVGKDLVTGGEANDTLVVGEDSDDHYVTGGYASNTPSGRMVLSGYTKDRGLGAVSGSGDVRFQGRIINPGFIRLLAAVFCFVLFSVYIDGQLERLFDTADFFSWPRLLYSVGAVGMGFLWDVKKKRTASVVMLVAAIISVLMPAFLTDERFFVFDICLFYVYLGLSLVYNTLRLIVYSVETGNKYAPVSYRAIDNLLTGFMVLIGFSGMPVLVALVLDTLLLILILLLMLKDGVFYDDGIRENRAYSGGVINGAAGGLSYGTETMEGANGAGGLSGSTETSEDDDFIFGSESLEETNDDGSVSSSAAASDRIAAFAGKYGLTDREKEAFKLLVTKDEKGDEMAKEMGVSRRGFVSLTSSIYRKTETGSRIALLQKYMSE